MLHLLVALAWMASGDAAGDTWPGFRGDGSSRTTARDLPLEWSAKHNLAWKVELPGYGQSSPVVWGGRVFLTAVDGAEKERCLVLALDAAGGKELWRKEFAASQKGKNNPSTSRAASTPVADKDGVYAFFESGDLVGLTHTGDVKWRRSLVKEYGELQNHHGLASSLAQTDKAVIVLVEHRGPSYLLAVEKATGKNLWKAERAKGLSWTSPVVTEQGGRPTVLVSSNGSLAGYDADTGKELWSLDKLSGNLIPSPVVAGGLVIVGAGESGLTTDLKAAARSNCCVRLTMKDGRPGCQLVWQGKRAICHHASPVAHRGCVYLVTKAGVLHCLDLETGEEHFAQRLGGTCWATPVAAGDQVFLFGKDGVTTVIKAGPKCEKVATNRLWSADDLQARTQAAAKRPENQFPPLPKQGKEQMEQMLKDAVGDVVYGVAAVDRTFFIRTGTELWCVRRPQ
jgi:outer membrane protein assembly factor BamB